MRAHFSEHDVDAFLVDRTQTVLGYSYMHPAILALDPQAPRLQVRHKAAARLVVRMGNVVSQLRFLTRNLTYPWHDAAPEFGRGAILHYFERLPKRRLLPCATR